MFVNYSSMIVEEYYRFCSSNSSAFFVVSLQTTLREKNEFLNAYKPQFLSVL